MKQLTLRQIPEPVAQALRALAQETGMSLNKTAINVLKRGLGLDASPKQKRDLSRIAGKWTDEEAEEFERNLEIFEQIDEEVWR
jgi:plasmid stability protein